MPHRYNGEESIVFGDRLTSWQVVRQSQLCHPDWDVATHIQYLDQAGYDWRRLGRPGETPEQCIARWLEENAER